MSTDTLGQPHHPQSSTVWPATQDSRDVFVSTTAGAVHLRRQGAGTAVFLMHSNGQSWREFERVIGLLAEDYDVIAWDMPGQGDSDPVHWRTSIDGYAQVAVEIFDALGIDTAVVAGCSVGAFVAACLARRFPERVTAAALAEFQVGGPDFWQASWDNALRSYANPLQSREEVTVRLQSELDDSLYERWTIDRLKAGSRSMLGVLWALRNYPMLADLEQMTVPAMVMMGDAGPAIHDRETVAGVLSPRQSLIVVERSGHFIALDNPTEFAAAVASLARSSG